MLVEFTPRPTLGDSWWGIYVNAIRVRNVYAVEGAVTRARVSLPWGSNSWNVIILHHGALSDPTYSSTLAVRLEEGVEGRRSNLEWTWPYEVLGDVDDEGLYLSNWVLNGVIPFDNILPVEGKPTWGQLEGSLTVSGGTATVELALHGSVVASGSGAVGTTVSFSASNGSGLYGSVDVIGGAATDADFDVYVRFPASASVLRNATDPPSTVVASVPFRGTQTERWQEQSELSPGTYYYALKMVSDTGVSGTASSSFPITILGHPQGPSGFSGFSGNKSAFYVGVVPSPTPGASYALYAADMNEVMDLVTPTLQDNSAHVSNFTMGPLGFTGFSGYAYVLVQGFSGGLRSNNGDVLKLEFDQYSAWIPPRPNPAGVLSFSGSGLTLTVIATQSTREEDLAATTVYLFVRPVDGAYDYTTPSATATLGAATNGVKRATLTYTAPTDGLYQAIVLAVASDGTRSTLDDAPEVLTYLSDDTPAAISGFSASINRG